MKISEVVYSEVKTAKEQSLKLADGYHFSQQDTIRRINLYINDKFLNCPDDTAIFWNLSTPRIPLYAKNIDMDSKDFMPEGVGSNNFYQAWILKVRFYKWARDNMFDITLNDLSEGIATYGSSIWKKVKVKGKVTIKEDDLRNLYFDYSVENVIDSPMVQLHYLTDAQILANKGWENKEEAIKKGIKKKDGDNTHKTQDIQNEKIEVWERWGEYKENIEDDPKYMHYIGTGTGDTEVILFKERATLEMFPYYDFHNGKYRGRWMRVGVVESLFKLQERCNTLVNQNAATTEISSLLLLRSTDTDTNANVLTQAQSGMIIDSQDLQQIGLDNRGLSAFIAEMQMIEAQADKLAFTPGVVSGDTPPSGTPFRSVAVVVNQAKSTFRYIRERMGDKIADLLLKDIMPGEVKGWNKGDTVKIAGDDNDIALYDDARTKVEVNNWLEDQYNRGDNPTLEEVAQFEAKTRLELENSDRAIKTPKGFFDFEYGFKYNPVGTKADKAQQNEAMINALNMTLANPAIQDIPLFKQLLENNNVSPYKVTPKQMEALQQPQGGKAPAVIKKEDKLSSLVDSE